MYGLVSKSIVRLSCSAVIGCFASSVQIWAEDSSRSSNKSSMLVQVVPQFLVRTMRAKCFLLLFTAVQVGFTVGIDYQAIRGSLERVNYYSESFTKGVGSGTLKSTRENLEELNKSFGETLFNFFRAAAYAFAGVSMSTENPVIPLLQDGLASVGRQLDRNLKAIQNLKHELKVEIRGLSLQGQLDDLESLVSLYEKSVERRSNLSADNFLAACHLSRVNEKPLWFTNALTIQDPGNLKHLILAEGDKDKLNSFYEQILSLFYEAVLMNSACLAARYVNEGNQTVEAVKNEFADDVPVYLRQIIDALDRDMDLLDNHFIQFAINDIQNCAEQYANYDNKDAVACLGSTFRAKYGKKFFAVAFGAKKSLAEHDLYFMPNRRDALIRRKDGKCDSYAHTFTNFHLRNYFVCFPSDCTSDDWKSAVGKCNTDPGETFNCKNRAEEVAECLRNNNADFTFLGCAYADFQFDYNNSLSIGFRYQPESAILVCK